jgi:hypothetical protein
MLSLLLLYPSTLVTIRIGPGCTSLHPDWLLLLPLGLGFGPTLPARAMCSCAPLLTSRPVPSRPPESTSAL